MRYIYKLISMCLLVLAGLSVQAQQPDSTMVEKYLLNFSVPDMPAFKALNTDPSDILRPSDVKKFAAMISPFYSNGKGVIPKNFALEVAPWKLGSSKWTLEDFNKSFIKRFLYRSSFSLGTVNDDTEFPSKLGAGYRVSFLSAKADIYRAAEIRNNIFAGDFSQESVMTAYTQLTNDWVNIVVKPAITLRPTYYQNNKPAFNEFLSGLKKYLADSPNAQIQQHYEALINAVAAGDEAHIFTPDELKDFISTYGKTVDAYIEAYQKKNWNASRFDLAIAWVGQSKDSLIANAAFSSFNVWATGALRVHKGGQLLVGGRATFARPVSKDSGRVSISANLRYYIGTKDFRGFLETQYKYVEAPANSNTLLINLGAEFRIGNSFWVAASGGLDNAIGKSNNFSRFVSSIDLRYGFNKPASD